MSITIRKIFYFIIILSFALAIGSVLVYKQIDLDDYRHHLEEQLGLSLGQPVSIGRGKLTFRDGLALDLRDLRIGQEDAPLAEVPRLTATLKIAPLLDGQIILKQVLIESPSLRIRLPMENRPARGATHQIFDSLGIRILTIHNANLQIEQNLKGASKKSLLRIDNFNAVLKNWQADQMGQLVVSGQLQQKEAPANFILDLSIPSSPDPTGWRKEQLKYQLTLHDLSTESFPKPPGVNLPKRLDLLLNLNGTPFDGALLLAEIRRSDNQQKLLKVAGNWVSTPEQENLAQLTGSLLGLPFSGEGLLRRQQENKLLSGRLETGRVKLNRVILDNWKTLGLEQLLGGELQQLSLTLEKEWPNQESFPGLPQIGLQVSLRNLDWNQPRLKQVREFSLGLSVTDQELRISNGQMVFAGEPIRFSGTARPFSDHPQVDLEIRGQPDLAVLSKKLSLPEGWKLTGNLPARIVLQGPLWQPGFTLDVDLGPSQLSLGQLLQKTSEQPGALKVKGSFNQKQLQVDRFRLSLAEFLMAGTGRFPRQQFGESFLIDIDSFELSPLQVLSPLLSKLNLHGEIHPLLERQNQVLRGSIRLQNVGNHLFNIVGDLNHASGDLRFDENGLDFGNLSLQIGESPLSVAGTLKNWPDPQLDLFVRGNQVRAQDLVFVNQELTFFDLDGHLGINRHGISFDPVQVRLEQDTTATVRGKVDNFHDPQLTLDIQSGKADILQVIQLFQGPRRNGSEPNRAKHRPTLISVKATQGTLGDLHFTNAYGSIMDHRGIFTLYPLRFQSGEGFCQARVEFDRNDPNGILKVSGHAEKVDATILHQDLFKERGLIKGLLNGDFYLEGSPKSGFWASAKGGIHLKVKNGTLRKFNGLATVFSLLNVSQLFAFQLPDMDKEGMPFRLLEGTVRIADGWMKTEDMHVVSEAMNLSLVGKESLVEDRVDFHLGVMPLRTVDKVVTSIPIAGWLLAGENKALFTVFFKIEGSSKNPDVTAIPVDSISDTVFGIIRRTFGLPGKLVKDIGSLFKSPPEKKTDSDIPADAAQ